jgi:aerobic-type carbon monoxide dehydrogenase small subunit (CoxS/CutS family)
MKLSVNGQDRVLEGVDPTMPLLWAIRDLLGLKGTKFGCGRAFCGACTVHMRLRPNPRYLARTSSTGDSASLVRRSFTRTCRRLEW